MLKSKIYDQLLPDNYFVQKIHIQVVLPVRDYPTSLSMLMESLIILALILLNGLFSMSEIALLSSKKFKLSNKAASGHKGAQQAVELSNHPGRFLSTIQIGITLIGILTGVYGGASIARSLEKILDDVPLLASNAMLISRIIIVITITFFTLVLGELFPKRLAMSAPEKIASLMAIPMRLLSKITQPAVWLLDKSTEALIYIFRIKTDKEDQVTEEEIRVMLQQAPEVEKEEKEMVDRVFFLGDTDVGSLMTHRDDLVMLNIEDSHEKQKRLISESARTHFPVYEGNTDNIIGVLRLKDYIQEYLQDDQVDLRSLLSEPLFVLENTRAFKLLDRMKEARCYFAIAVNEFGHIMGVVTSNDLFKVMIGLLYRTGENLEIVKRSDNSYLVDGLISLDEFFRYFKIENTDDIEDKGFYTLGGMLLYLMGHIPETGEEVQWRHFTFEVVDMDGKRVDKVLVKE